MNSISITTEAGNTYSVAPATPAETLNSRDRALLNRCQRMRECGDAPEMTMTAFLNVLLYEITGHPIK